VIDQRVWQTSTWTTANWFGIAASVNLSDLALYHCFRWCLCRYHSLARTNCIRQIFLGAAIFPRKYGRSVILERPYILGNFAAATIFPSDEISCDTGMPWPRESVHNYSKHQRRVSFGQLDCVSSLLPLYSWVIVMYSSRLSVPAIGDKAHQPSLFKATTTFLPIFTNSAVRPSDRLAATWLRLTELEIDGFK